MVEHVVAMKAMRHDDISRRTELAHRRRGNLRASNGTASGVHRCDIGAFEFWAPTLSIYMPYLREIVTSSM